MSINAEVSKSGSESTLSVIRKFSRRVQGTGLVKNARKTRYYERAQSKAVQKKRALKLIKRRSDFKQLVKEGKAPETPVRRGFQNRDANTSQADANKQQAASTPARFGESTPIAR